MYDFEVMKSLVDEYILARLEEVEKNQLLRQAPQSQQLPGRHFAATLWRWSVAAAVIVLVATFFALAN